MRAIQMLMLLPDTDFDPTESAIPWQVLAAAGHAVRFATESGRAGRCDPRTLLGDGLPLLAGSLRCRDENLSAYEAMEKVDAFRSPLRWADADPDDFDALVLPGGHAPGMKPLWVLNIGPPRNC